MSGADSLSSWRIVEGFGSQPAADPASPHTYIGANIGEWRIRKLLGVGGMGAVYEALRDVPAGEEPGLPVAVKVLSPQLSAEPEIRKRFVREARAQARLDHPNIIPVLDAGEHDDTPYLVMPMFSGGSLKDLLHERKRLPEDEAIDLWVPLLEALDHAHSRGYVHRDIKPDNVMLDNAGQPWLADFGLVGSLGDTYVSTRISAHGGLPKAVSGVGDGQLTYAGEVLGTPAYMSPEQCQGRVIDQRSDLYSFGCLMYHCLCGRPPFVEDNPWAYFMRHLDTVPPSPREVVPDLSDDVVAIIQRLLAKSREERFPTAAEVARVLRDGYLDDVYRMNSKQQRMAARAISGRHGGVARGISDRRPPSLAAGGGSRGRRPGAASRDRSMPPVAVQMEPPPRRAPAPPPTRSNLGALVALAGVLAIGAIVSLIVAVTSQSGNTNAAANTAAGNDTRKPPPPVANNLAEAWPERYTALVTGLADPALGQRFKDLAPERQQIIAALSPELRANSLRLDDATIDLLAGLSTTTQALLLGFAPDRLRRLGAPLIAIALRVHSRPEFEWRRVDAIESGAAGANSTTPVVAVFRHAALAESLRLADSETEPACEFVLVPGGSYRMGTSDAELATLSMLGEPTDDFVGETPEHAVRVAPFLIARTELTQAAFDRLRGSAVDARLRTLGAGPRVAAYNASWAESARLLVGAGLRMPSEAEWEFACRAGTTTPWSYGGYEHINESLEAHGWFYINAGRQLLPYDTAYDLESVFGEWKCRAHDVAARKPNPLGLFDMHGNVWEWCADVWLDDYRGAPEDARPREGRGDKRPVRGGSWRNTAYWCRSAFRFGAPDGQYPYVGVRAACSVE